MATQAKLGYSSELSPTGHLVPSSPLKKCEYKVDISSFCVQNVLPILQIELRPVFANKEINDYIIAVIRIRKILDPNDLISLNDINDLAIQRETERMKSC